MLLNSLLAGLEQAGDSHMSDVCPRPFIEAFGRNSVHVRDSEGRKNALYLIHYYFCVSTRNRRAFGKNLWLAV
jgi:hypothetical protein